MIVVRITTPIGLVQTCNIGTNGLLENTSVPHSVACQIEEAIQKQQRSGVAVYEDSDTHGPYKCEFPWEVQTE